MLTEQTRKIVDVVISEHGGAFSDGVIVAKQQASMLHFAAVDVVVQAKARFLLQDPVQRGA